MCVTRWTMYNNTSELQTNNNNKHRKAHSFNFLKLIPNIFTPVNVTNRLISACEHRKFLKVTKKKNMNLCYQLVDGFFNDALENLFFLACNVIWDLKWAFTSSNGLNFFIMLLRQYCLNCICKSRIIYMIFMRRLNKLDLHIVDVALMKKETCERYV